MSFSLPKLDRLEVEVAKMPMLKDPSSKYRSHVPLKLQDRTWPDQVLSKPPRWLSTDLRDGNQALVDPMNGEQKWEYLQMLLKCGFKEIEIAFPSASQPEFDFVRKTIESGILPDDVFIQVLTPCREELIHRTVESVRGAKNAIIHLYNATSPCFRDVVFQNTKEETVALAVNSTKIVRQLTKDSDPRTNWQFEYSPETFSGTEPDFALEVCEAVKAAWEPSVANKIIFNLPATVELSTPNIYADQIEYFCRHITEREKVSISLHPHNDRGTAIAACELAQMGGGDRVEGVLFGNGERTGNVDITTLALNLYTQGINPKLDFSDLQSIVRVVSECTNLPVHPRHPYAGDLVFTAFSGSHQDAIKKGFAVQRSRKDGRWDVPYLPLDPADLGATYEAVIRVNSQSGKGGVAWVIQERLQLDLPRRLQISFSRKIQRLAEAKSAELTPTEITTTFIHLYHLQPQQQTTAAQPTRFTLVDYDMRSLDTKSTEKNKEITLRILDNQIEKTLTGFGNGPISCALNALAKELSLVLDVREYKEHAIGTGRDTKAAAYLELTFNEAADADPTESFWGVGIDSDTVMVA